MLTSHDLLRSYARLLHRLSGAEAVSLYLPSSTAGPEGPRLIHDNGHPAVPELADVAAAGDLLDAVETELAWSAGSPLSRPSRRGRAPVLLASRAPGGRLIRVPADLRLPDLGSAAEAGVAQGRHRRRADHRGVPGDSTALWIGLKLADSETTFPGEHEPLWRGALAHGAVVAGHCRRVDSVLSDPVTELPGRADFQATLRREVAAALEDERGLALMLTNPDDFTVVNERFGSAAGDRVVREIATRLQHALRGSDLVHRYGGVVFAVVLPNTSRPDGVAVAEKLHGSLTGEGYLDGAVRLGFSIGLASLEDTARDADDAAWALIRRADRALSKAKLSSSSRVEAWRPGSDNEVVMHRDRLSGIFTADLAKDYRNMLLLWDTVELINATADPGELAARAVERLSATFKPERAGLFRFAADGNPELAAGHGGRGAGSGRPGKLALGAAERALLERARAEQKLVQGRLESTDEDAASTWALPLQARGQTLGCLYLAGRAEATVLDASDLMFLKALAGQLATALDRAELAARERRRLRAEVEELRGALEETKMVYSSPRMEALMDTVRRVAPTEATVLVTGESGTGKELVARAVHALSTRRAKPPVLVDCGAISATLIDSELFGHEKGAYTGAAGRTVGRLAEADGSTVILDEIGELPLAVQSKLLRFVQEKQITPVGGTRPRTVDARLVAVTHRDLATEVAAGRFRADLYYRLQVVHLEVPPLAKRADDMPLLIDHFVERFAARYRKDVRGLSPTATALAARYAWPGNVRELENRILQAVILCEGEEISERDLRLCACAPAVDASTARTATEAGPSGSAPRLPAVPSLALPGGDPPAPEDAWEALRCELRRLITAQGGPSRSRPPLGRWLEEDLVIEALAADGGVIRRAARRLGMAETTFARRLQRAESASAAGASTPPAREALRPAVLALLRTEHPAGTDLCWRARRELLTEVCQLLSGDDAASAALLGVTVPTFRRRRQEALSASES